MKYQANGVAMRMATTTNIKNSLESNPTRFSTEAPSTFRIPISLVLLSATNAANANKPKQDTNMANAANIAISLANL